MFEEWGILGNILILLLSLIILDKASDWAVTKSIKIADITSLGKTRVGFILMATSTSIPELCVSIFASIGGGEKMGIAIGNVIGSNITNICLILGICFPIYAWKTTLTRKKNIELIESKSIITEKETEPLYFGLLIASIIPLTLIYLYSASKILGVILIAIFILYTIQLSKNTTQEEIPQKDKPHGKLEIYKYTLQAITGIFIIIISAYFIVETSSYIARSIGIPEIVIGATIIALGTSLPELSTSIDSTKKGHIDLTLGNIIGSCFTNITLILGVALINSELTINITFLYQLTTFTLIANLLLWFFLSNKKTGLKEGIILLTIYVIFILTNLPYQII